jgi:hypothetical protein
MSDEHRLLSPWSSDLSDPSSAVTSPPVVQRQGYRRKKTSEHIELMPTTPELEQDDGDLTSLNQQERLDHGLGIAGANRPPSITRVPVGSRNSAPRSANTSQTSTISSTPQTKSTPHTPGSAKPLLSPAWQRQDSKDYIDINVQEGRTISYDCSTFPPEHSRGTSTESFQEPFVAEDDITQLKHYSGSTLDNGLSRGGCESKHDLHASRGTWLSITLLILSVYSTVMSILWLVTAIVQPRWGRQIYSGGSLTPSSASLISALLSKTIELSFVTVFVGFLGQALSRRSIAHHRKGVTIAEMSMRTWVIQPGFMLTHWQTLRYAGWTILGVISFIAAIAAMFYTTASDALVSPKLQFGKWEARSLQGLVQTSYANPQFVKAACQTPITVVEDAAYAADTCLAIQYGGESKHFTFDSLAQLPYSISMPKHIFINAGESCTNLGSVFLVGAPAR